MCAPAVCRSMGPQRGASRKVVGSLVYSTCAAAATGRWYGICSGSRVDERRVRVSRGLRREVGCCDADMAAVARSAQAKLSCFGALFGTLEYLLVHHLLCASAPNHRPTQRVQPTRSQTHSHLTPVRYIIAIIIVCLRSHSTHPPPPRFPPRLPPPNSRMWWCRSRVAVHAPLAIGSSLPHLPSPPRHQRPGSAIFATRDQSTAARFSCLLLSFF